MTNKPTPDELRQALKDFRRIFGSAAAHRPEVRAVLAAAEATLPTPSKPKWLSNLDTPTHALSRLEDAHSAIVTGLQGEPGIRERLAELGFTPGTGVTVVSRAPNGGPLRVRVRGGFLALRRDEAAQVRVHPAGDAARAAAGCAA